MGRKRDAWSRLGMVALLAALLAGPSVPARAEDDPRLGDECTGPVVDPEPGTVAWTQRDALNMLCASQRQRDLAANPAFTAAYAEALATFPPSRLTPKPANRPGFDPFRVPWTRWEGTRGRYLQTSFVLTTGERLAVELFAPLGPCQADCPALPEGLERYAPPYPAVAWMVGGGGQLQQQWGLAETLAESGYVVFLFDPPGAGESGGVTTIDYQPVLREALDWFFSAANPWAAEIDHGRVGAAGWSLGAIAANKVGQDDPRIRTIVGWDTCENIVPEGDVVGIVTGCESRPPSGSRLRAPALQLTADLYGFTGVPYPMVLRPNPHRLDRAYTALRNAGIEAMQVSLRAATHLDFGAFYQTGTCLCSRYGEQVALYFTKAWFDYHLKGAVDPNARLDAFRRLTAERFDDSVDRHAIGAGTFDSAVGNVPYRIGGLRIADRLSFYFLSGYSLQPVPYTQHTCDDLRAGC